MTKPLTFAVSRAEGQMWEPFTPNVRPPSKEGWRVSAIMFADGSQWDAYNGWRTENTKYPLMTPNDVRAAWLRDGVTSWKEQQ